MKLDDSVLTSCQLADVLQIKECTIELLVQQNKIPYIVIKDDVRFYTDDIEAWLKAGNCKANEINYLKLLETKYTLQFPEALEELRQMDNSFSGKRKAKGYTLSKVKNKKYGFLYYVRYFKDGKIVPTRWSTHTNNIDYAHSFAKENKERLIAQYYKRSSFYSTIGDYYSGNSAYFQKDLRRGRQMQSRRIKQADSFVVNTAVPFFKLRNVKDFDALTPPLIADFQDYLLLKGMRPQTANGCIAFLAVMFDSFVSEGIVKDNVFRKIKRLRVKDSDYVKRMCYDIDKIKGVFNKDWTDKTSYILCLLIYTTGLRNSEIERIKYSDIMQIDGCYFIDVKRSKTKNGVRLVPLPAFVCEKINSFCRSSCIDDACIFAGIKKKAYSKANIDLYKMLEPDSTAAVKHLKSIGISFYSGRHFYKTLLNSAGMGDIEEVFMGHSVSSDVAKRYNHFDKQGRSKLLERAREVYRIIEEKIFDTPVVHYAENSACVIGK